MVYHQWPVGQAVKTSPSHGENRSSILLRVTTCWRTNRKTLRCITATIVGVYYAEGPPVPIPNTVVKLIRAEDTRRAASRENRSMPTLKKTDSFESVFLICFYCSVLPSEYLTLLQRQILVLPLRGETLGAIVKSSQLF